MFIKNFIKLLMCTLSFVLILCANNLYCYDYKDYIEDEREDSKYNYYTHGNSKQMFSMIFHDIKQESIYMFTNGFIASKTILDEKRFNKLSRGSFAYVVAKAKNAINTCKFTSKMFIHSVRRGRMLRYTSTNQAAEKDCKALIKTRKYNNGSPVESEDLFITVVYKNMLLASRSIKYVPPARYIEYYMQHDEKVKQPNRELTAAEDLNKTQVR